MRYLSGLLLAVSLSACGGGDGRCTAGATAACVCVDGEKGAQVCLPSGSFGECQCVGGTTGTTGGTTGTTGGTTGTTGGTTGTTGGSGAPSILSFGTDTTTLTAGGSLMVTAVITDPLGVDNLAGGSLTSANGSTTWDAFTAGAQKGAFSATLTWAQIEQSMPITFAGSQSLGLAATFFNMQGASISRAFSVELTCNSGNACDGSCVDLTTSHDDCGHCGHVCTSNYPQNDPNGIDDPSSCVMGRCFGPTTKQTTSPTSCNDVCAQLGGICMTGCSETTVAPDFYSVDNNGEQNLDCDTVEPAFTGSASIFCCCGT